MAKKNAPKVNKQRARELVKKQGRLEKKIAKREAAGEGTKKASTKLGRVTGKLENKAEKLGQRVTQRQGAGKRTGPADKLLAQIQTALGQGPAASTQVPQFAAGPTQDTTPQSPTVTPPPPTVTPPTTPPPPPTVTAPPPGLGAGPSTFTLPGGQPPGTGAPGAGGPPGQPGSEFNNILGGQFGAGNPFGTAFQPGIGSIAANLGQGGSPFAPLPNFGPDPIASATRNVQNFLGQNLAQQNAGFAGQGLGGSSRRALESGAAIGQAGALLGDVLSQRGLQTRSQDLNRLLTAAGQQQGANQSQAGLGLQAALGASNVGLGQQQLALQGLSQLAGLGTGLTGIGAQEQIPPALSGILGLLGLFPSTQTSGGQSGIGRTGIFV